VRKHPRLCLGGLRSSPHRASRPAGLVLIGAGMLAWGIPTLKHRALGGWSLVPVVIAVCGLTGITFVNPVAFAAIENGFLPVIFGAERAWGTVLEDYSATVTRGRSARDRPVPGVPVERTDPAATVTTGRSLSIVMSFPLSPVGATPHSDRPSGGSTPARTCGPRCARPIGHQQMRQGQWAAAHIPRM